MLKKELRKILLSLSFVFVAAVSCAQYVVTGGSESKWLRFLNLMFFEGIY